MKAAHCQPDAGFTLLELLISLSIFALIMVALTEGVRFSGQAWRTQEASNVRQGDINAVQGVLRQMIVSGQEFNGRPEDLKFVGKLPAALARGGLFDIELALEDDKLVLFWAPHFKGPSAHSERNQTVILDGIVTTSFSYNFGSNGWQNATNGQSKQLQLIDIQAQLANGRTWPQFVVAPMVAAPAKLKA